MVRVVVAEASRVKREVSTLAVHLLLPPPSLALFRFITVSLARCSSPRDEKTSRPSSRSPSVLASHANLFDARHNDRFPSPPTRSRREKTWRRNSRLHNCMYVYMYIYLYVKCNEDASRVGEIETYLRLANENSQGYERMESME